MNAIDSAIFSAIERKKLFSARAARRVASLAHTGWPKNWHLFSVRHMYQILTDFQNYFTVRVRRKFAMILSLKIQPHLKCVATLPCEMSSFFLKRSNDHKTTCVTTHFKKLTTGNNVIIVLVIV